jgi:hypothetical protein
VIGPEGTAAADAAARTWARAWGRRPLVEGQGFRELVAWRGSSLLWCGEGFLHASTAGPRCARTAELALRLLEATAASEVDAFGLAEADALLLARASTARGVLFHGRAPASARPLPVARPPGPRWGLFRAFAGAFAPALASLPPAPGAGSGRDASPIVAVVDGAGTRTALDALFQAAAEGRGRPVWCVTLDELPRWYTRRARRASGEAESLLRDRLARLRGTAGLAESYSHRGIGFADLAGGDLEALLTGHLAAAVRRLEAAVELLGAARATAALVAVPGRDERRTLVLAAAAARVEAVTVSPGRRRAADTERADAGPRPMAALEWSPGDDPAPVVARLREAARGRVNLA